MEVKTTTLRIWPSTRDKMKLEALTQGMTMIQFMDALVAQAINNRKKHKILVPPVRKDFQNTEGD